MNDHDPKPLCYPFQAELGEPFQSEYFESGPEVWRIQIAKFLSK